MGGFSKLFMEIKERSQIPMKIFLYFPHWSSKIHWNRQIELICNEEFGQMCVSGVEYFIWK